ncbi:MAG: fibronectin type III domain-containing protein [Thermodesulfovibrionales bacterium]
MRITSLSQTAFFVLFSVMLLTAACGKKGAPTLKSYDKPVAPSGLTAINREDKIYLQWTFPKDKEITVRQIAILRAAETDFIKIALTEAGARSYVDAVTEPDAQYRYKVAALNHRGVFSPDSNTVLITASRAPSPPQVLTFQATDRALELKWQSQGNGLMYNVYKSEEPGRYDMVPVNRVPLTLPSFTDSLMLNKTVYYTVRCLTDAATRNESASSAEIVVDPGEFVPRTLQGVRYFASEVRIFLSWDLPAETWVTGFRVYRKTGAQEYALIAETQIPAFIDQDPSPSERAYRVHALGPRREGAGVEIRGVRLEPRE